MVVLVSHHLQTDVAEGGPVFWPGHGEAVRVGFVALSAEGEFDAGDLLDFTGRSRQLDESQLAELITVLD